jgi:hypothetical protein
VRKAILVVEPVPDNCHECRFCRVGKMNRYCATSAICVATYDDNPGIRAKALDLADVKTKRADWCPIRISE